MNTNPEFIESLAQLDEMLTRPTPRLIAYITSVSSSLLILGAGGKMGPTLAVLAKRAAAVAGHALDVIAVSRFSQDSAREWLEAQGVKTLAVDLMEPDQYAELPDAKNIIYLVGMKFGTSQNPELTWAINTLAPSYVAQRFQQARIVALSTGNVYPFTPIENRGSLEDDPLTPPGEYANACVARERIFAYHARRLNTPMTLIRLYYALDLRYGVVLDIARKIDNNEKVDLNMGYFNAIWQGDANEMIIRSLALATTPTYPINLTGTETLSVREVAEQLAAFMGKSVEFSGQEQSLALLGNTTRMVSHLGNPATALQDVIRWTAHWVQSGGPVLGKPTHFEVRDGRY